MVWNAFSSNHLACRIVARAPSRSLTSTKGTEKIKIFNRIKSEKFALNGSQQISVTDISSKRGRLVGSTRRMP